MGSRGSGYVRKNGSAGTEQPGLTGEDKKWLKRISFDGQTAYVNPDNDRLIATTTFSGKVRFLDQAELENYRKTHDMQTGQVKKAYIHELARQAAELRKNGNAGGEAEVRKYSVLLELAQIAGRIDPAIGTAVEWRSGIGTVIHAPVMRKVERTLGVKIM